MHLNGILSTNILYLDYTKDAHFDHFYKQAPLISKHRQFLRRYISVYHRTIRFLIFRLSVPLVLILCFICFITFVGLTGFL